MKKFLAVILSVAFACIALVGCAGNNNSEESKGNVSKTEKTYTIGAVDGAPTLSLVSIADGSFAYSTQTTEYKTSATVAADANAVVANLKNGTYDMAILPLNNAVTLYNDNSDHDFKLASVNVFGVLYMIGKTDIGENLSALKGKVVYAVGGGGTPGLVFKHLLARNNIKFAMGDTVEDSETVYIKAISGAPDAIAGLTKGDTEFVVLGEPAVTQVSAKTGAKVVLDFKKEWQKLHGENSAFVQAGLVVNTAKVDRDYVAALVEKLKDNKQYLYDNTDKISERLTAMGSTTIAKLTFTEELLNRCNIGCETASSQKTNIEAFLSAHSITLPENDFYYI